ncbi:MULTISPECIES: hypothetical protein [unclassified Streptomyces]|uniref:hypothetical protein n=1 Tax=unclassified Streptomyces TaxID=2593676 RepID=UPI0013A6ED46|nr:MULTISPECIES: hypothetical protein [unclassified Streptomyces]QZZ24903.1 hypothetical protein A7X85_21220 [Streptomyces sp. ST1015]
MDAPILFANSIGGYLPSPVAEPGARGRTRRVRAPRSTRRWRRNSAYLAADTDPGDFVVWIAKGSGYKAR